MGYRLLNPLHHLPHLILPWETIPRRLRIVLVLLMVFLLSSGAAFHAPHGVATTAERWSPPEYPLSLGVNSHLATRYTNLDTMDIPAEQLEELGVSWVREDFHWYRVQPTPDTWDWSFNDGAVRELLNRDINILGVIGGPSAPWATPEPDDNDHYASFHAPDTESFVRFAQAVVKRYHRHIDHWEIWNEPDNPHFWKPAPDPKAYADLLIRTSAAIKKIDPDANVLIGGFNPFDWKYINGVLETDGAWESFDILAIHPYVDPHSPEDGNITTVADVVHVLSSQYGTKPIWVTEVGWSSGPGDHDPLGINDEHQQARFLPRAMVLLWQAGVERIFWYTLKDDLGNPYGLFEYGEGRDDYSLPKPAYYTFRTLNRYVQDARFIKRHDLFDHRTVLDFDRFAYDNWRRPVQPNGSLQDSGVGTARLTYHFSTKGNDYVSFERRHPIALEGTPHAIGVWVYGDGSGHKVNVWLRDAEGEMLQFTLGVVGAPGWKFISAPIGNSAYPGNRIGVGGNGTVQFPVTFEALVLDDREDSYTGTGIVYFDDLTLIGGREVYDFQVEKNGELIDLVWSPPGLIRATLTATTPRGELITHDGDQHPLTASGGRFSFEVGPDMVLIRHLQQ